MNWARVYRRTTKYNLDINRHKYVAKNVGLYLERGKITLFSYPRGIVRQETVKMPLRHGFSVNYRGRRDVPDNVFIILRTGFDVFQIIYPLKKHAEAIVTFI